MYLLDTHVLIWFNMQPARVSARAREAVESGLAKVSVISLWELILKKNRTGTPVPTPLTWWDRYVTRAEVDVVAIRIPHLRMLDQLPDLHRDPFDRMLVAQARVEGLKIVTADAALARYSVGTVW